MKLTKDSPGGMILALGLICLVSGALLSGVYKLTAAPIEAARSARQTEAIARVIPPFDNNPAAEAATIYTDGDAEAVTLFPAREGGRFVGSAVSSCSMLGFSGRIDIIFGFDADGNVTGYEVMKHAETPGLGARMTDWFAPADTADRRNVIGRNPATTDMTVSKDGGEIDGITAATITSRAFLDALRRAHTAFIQYKSEHPEEM